MANLKFISTGSTTVTLSGNGLSNSFTANGSAYTLGTAISLADGEYVEFAGSTNDFSKDGSHYYQFSIGGTGTVTVEGDLVSLINNNAFVKQYQFVNLFKDCTKITSIANLNFPASIADFCYSNMFAHCTGLVNGGTTLPATSVSRWCYNGMFVDCSSMTTPPTILAEEVAPFCYYQMFAGCTSLTEGPTLNNFTVEGRMNSNCMFKDCSNLSTIQVNFRNWPAEANINQSRKWLEGVSQTGLFVKPNTLTTIPTGVIPAGWTLSSTYPAQIIVADQTYSFDAMSETDQTKIFGFSYIGGSETLNINVDTTNLPSWLTYTTDSDSIDFSANGYQIDSSTTVQIPITFSAADAETKNVVATFDISNYPTATITVSTIPTFTFDADSETDIVSSLMTYATGSNSISCQIEGELPDGLSCVDGIITGVPTDFTRNYSGSFDIVYSASDARNVSSSFDLEIINAAPEYLQYYNIPLTFKALNGSAIVQIQKSNNPPQWNSVSYKVGDGEWQSYSLNQQISLQQNETVSFSGTNTYWSGGTSTDNTYNNYYYFNNTGDLQMYGFLGSLINWSHNVNNFYAFTRMFNGRNSPVDAENLVFPTGTITPGAYQVLLSDTNDLSKLKKIPRYLAGQYITNSYYYGEWSWAFQKLKSVTNGPLIEQTTIRNRDEFNEMFYNSSSLSSVEVKFTQWWSSSTRWLYGVANTGLFIKPPTLPVTRGSDYIPNNWTVLNRHSDGTLWYVNSSNVETGQYTGDDPYAWYYQ